VTPESLLKQYWNYSSFRPGQAEIIAELNKGRDSIVLLPTGGGKSLCFQIPGLLQNGLTLVVSPLIALMRDQVEGLIKRDIPAAAIHSGHSKGEIELKLQNALKGAYKFLYISPERLATDNFRGYLKNLNINLLVVDEAHCISQWGYDFRPPYLQIAECRELLPGVPIAAFTASAPPRIVKDVVEKLELKNAFIYRGDFHRPNLHFYALDTENRTGYLTRLLARTKGSAIVFADTRRDTEEIARFLDEKGISADFYHAGLPTDQRSKRQDAWMKGKVKTMVCTNAFGMGVDKPDVRVVVHMTPPANPEDYYQEAGRAGRDGLDSWCIMLYRDTDFEEIKQRVIQSFPAPADLERVYNAMMNHLGIPAGGGAGRQFEIDLSKVTETYKIPNQLMLHATKSLELLGFFNLSESVLAPSRLRFIAEYIEVYEFKIRYPKYQALIDLLLRSFGGVFDAYVRISERQLGRRINISDSKIQEQLLQMHKAGILDYLAANDKPIIDILEPRSPYPKFNIKQLEPLRKTKLEGAKVMQSYAAEKNCRAGFWIQHYTEQTYIACGKCDLCTKRKKEALKGATFDTLSSFIKTCLGNEGLERQSLLSQFASEQSFEAREVLRWLMDNKKILVDSNQKLYWNNK
jgi:ATP-dependent DNA helicase RecQ